MAQQLLDQANDAFRRSRWTRAIACYAGVIKASPLHLRARLRLADALLNAGHRVPAQRVYAAVAEHAVRYGQPLIGLVAIKMQQLIEPEGEDASALLAELYAIDSGPTERPELSRSRTPPLGAATAVPEDDALVDIATQLATHWPSGLTPPAGLPWVPLLSDLSEDDLLLLLDKISLRRFSADQPIIRQGERAESFFWLADGQTVVKRDIADDGGVTLGHLHEGALFGEMALIADEPRHAAVLAESEVDVLEVRVSDLIVASSHAPSLRDAVRNFTRERFLRNLTATHPLFSGLARADRHDVVSTFTVANFDEGDTIIPQGQSGPGLFLILAGAAAVAKERDGERVLLASLRAGDLCGEMSLVSEQVTMATVTATERTEALFLPRESFRQLTRQHPHLLAYLASLTDERLRRNRSLLVSDLLDDDEHVLL